jgi:hypothetical protein
MQANRMGLPHLEHGRIPISARLFSGFGWMDDMTLSLRWAGALPISQSPMDAEGAAMMEPACASEFRRCWSILLTFQNNGGSPFRVKQVGESNREVRFSPANGHRQAVSACPKSA